MKVSGNGDGHPRTIITRTSIVAYNREHYHYGQTAGYTASTNRHNAQRKLGLAGRQQIHRCGQEATMQQRLAAWVPCQGRKQFLQ